MYLSLYDGHFEFIHFLTIVRYPTGAHLELMVKCETDSKLEIDLLLVISNV